VNKDIHYYVFAVAVTPVIRPEPRGGGGGGGGGVSGD